MKDLDYCLMLDMIARAKGKKADVELISIGDHTRYEVIIKKVMFCKNFAFYWTNEENEIHYSGIYEFSDGTNDKFDIYNNIVKRLVPPFTEAVLTAPETRSSSPVRIIRNDCFQSNISGIYPCGEGAGYAGGIVSAAVDGIKCAHAVLGDERIDIAP